MNRSSRSVILTSAVLGVAGLSFVFTSSADATQRRDPVSLTRTSPTVVGGESPADIFHVVSNPGVDSPEVHITANTFGLVSDIIDEESTRDNVTGASNGETSASLLSDTTVFFSVSLGSNGAAGTIIADQKAKNQHAADRFGVVMSTTPSAVYAGAPAATGGTAYLAVNQHEYGLTPNVDASQTFIGTQDDADALETTEFRFSGEAQGTRSKDIYFTLDAASNSLLADAPGSETWTAADILYAEAFQITNSRFASSGQLGLVSGDTLDAIAVWDIDADGVADAGQDYVLFSLTGDSPSNGGSGANLFVSSFTGAAPVLYASYSSLGLQIGDEIDAVDVIPEPTSLAAIALLGVAGLRRRR